MKIIKRSGSEVTFDLQKIINAINGANSEVKNGERLTERQVVYAAQNVADRCEAAGHTVSVEEIQDMVEDEIMASTASRSRGATSSTDTFRASSVRRTPRTTRSCL